MIVQWTHVKESILDWIDSYSCVNWSLVGIHRGLTIEVSARKVWGSETNIFFVYYQIDWNFSLSPKRIWLVLNQIFQNEQVTSNKFLTTPREFELEGYFKYSSVVVRSTECSSINFTENNYVNRASCLQPDSLPIYLGFIFK